mmetsp:Transcript_33800/g.79822  ORF Transcript_33800/g.79822 Transcript_33800/m.79822 type:complete len:289 (+) Transcript_33800:166-1032(+)
MAALAMTRQSTTFCSMRPGRTREASSRRPELAVYICSSASFAAPSYTWVNSMDGPNSMEGPSSALTLALSFSDSVCVRMWSTRRISERRSPVSEKLWFHEFSKPRLTKTMTVVLLGYIISTWSVPGLLLTTVVVILFGRMHMQKLMEKASWLATDSSMFSTSGSSLSMGAVEGSGASGSGIRSTTILEAVATSAMMMGENALPGRPGRSVMSTLFLCRAIAKSSLASSTLLAMGLSHMTSFPASSEEITTPFRMLYGAETSTKRMPGLSTAFCSSEYGTILQPSSVKS